MNFNFKYLNALAFAFFCMPSWGSEPCPQNNADIVGIAVAGDDGKFLYCERYFQLDNTHWRVEYSRGDELIVQKSLDYLLGGQAPLVEQKDYRTGELRKVSLSEDESQWRIAYRLNAAEKEESKGVVKEGAQVIDAGFDFFVRQQWDIIYKGEAVVFDFLSIPHLKSIALRARRVDIEKCGSFNVEVEGGVCITVAANSRLLRFFVDPLTLLYDAQQRLIVFNGAVNIQGSDAKSQTATISYRYKSVEAR